MYRRIDALMQQAAALGLDAEQARVLERYHITFRRAGAALDAAAKKRLAEIIERLATLGTAFSQNVLADEQAYALALDREEELAGLPDFVRDAMAADAQERGMKGHVVTLSRSSVEPFLQFSARRDLREKAFRAFIARGDNGGATDNKAIIAEMVRLRAERAQLLGYPDFAHYRLDDAMAKTPAAVRDLLDTVWAPARARALADRDAMQALVQEEGGNFALAPWDWRYYAEKLRKRRCDFDEAEIKPYLQLDAMIEAAFDTARTTVRPALPSARRRAGLASGCAGVGGARRGRLPRRPVLRRLFRAAVQAQRRLDDVAARSGEARGRHPAADRQRHEFLQGRRRRADAAELRRRAHAVPRVRPRAARAAVGRHVSRRFPAPTSPTDFVELPSQLYEHWLEQPEVLRRFAMHYETGEPMPDDLLQRLVAARNFNQGFATVEYLASAIVDLDFHSLATADNIDAKAFETAALARIGMPDEIVMRHRPPHFAHVFSGGGYAAAYYSYMWSEVLDADAFAAFEETGDIFDPATAKRLRDTIYAAGGLRDPAEAYKAFRGRLPTADALLRKRGFVDAGVAT